MSGAPTVLRSIAGSGILRAPTEAQMDDIGATARSVKELVTNTHAATVLITASASANGVAHSKILTRRDEAWNRHLDDLVKKGWLQGGPDRFQVSDLGTAALALMSINDDDLFAMFWLYTHYNSDPMFPSDEAIRSRYESHPRVPPWDRLIHALERMAKAGNVATGERRHKPFYITSPTGCTLIHHATVLGFTQDNITIHRSAP